MKIVKQELSIGKSHNNDCEYCVCSDGMEPDADCGVCVGGAREVCTQGCGHKLVEDRGLAKAGSGYDQLGSFKGSKS